ncbi:hypothetical protein [Robertmurraya kyonggiensis]|uniref:Secreted protein n=1 Tax=Robertmurraya kyonggiensis TaxID=1037680 RepID=A0A4U1DA75_9BACI|nr:hypothetical protein [Robertmurraya kyonggiensis]TKC18336.1 hypothetical protein FA727_01945 [Robertmurraya kyonggiensis]
MRRWAIAGMLYMTIVIFCFQFYNERIAKDDTSVAQAEGQDKQGMKGMENMEETNTEDHGSEESVSGEHGEEEGESDHSHGSDSTHEEGSQVNAFVVNDKENIKIFLKDKAGNPVDELKVNHEKILHLIMVDEQLQKYYHVHPERTGKGEFTISNNLPDGFYKAYVDIKPKNLAYEVEAIPFVVGNPDSSTHGHPLEIDTDFTKSVDGETVKLNISSFRANIPVQLSFELDETNLTPYLGAMGHVVILDEYGKKFLHVHPTNDDEPVFETTFEKPGVYKIWAEFKQNGKVRAFPFVIEVKE